MALSASCNSRLTSPGCPLRELVAAGVVTRHVESGPPISVTYALAGELTAALCSLRAWAATKAS